ncbi:MAG: SRPBCC family protein [Gemmatimonadota bacterium]
MSQREPMHTHNEIRIAAPLPRCLEAARDVERWPDLLAHYREVRFLRRDGRGAGLVRMTARRDFGPLPWPIWWASEMETDPDAGVVRYRHVDGITTGMDVEWRLAGRDGGTRIVILHDWEGPAWPVIGGLAARTVIGPHFIRVVAQRTLEGLRAVLEPGADGP